MADMKLTAKTPLDGRDVTLGGCRLRELDLHLTSLAIPLGATDDVANNLKKTYGLAMPDARTSTVANDVRAMRLAPDQLMLLGPEPCPLDTAYVTDQTGNWCIVELSGARAQDCLERLCPVDLHPSAFPEGAFARTVMEHMGAVVLRIGPERFLLLSASSSARSFWHALETTLHYIA